MLCSVHEVQDGAMTDPLGSRAGGGGPNGAAAGGERHNGGAHPGAGWMHDERWPALRRRGEAAGWLVDPSQVREFCGFEECPSSSSLLDLTS